MAEAIAEQEGLTLAEMLGYRAHNAFKLLYEQIYGIETRPQAARAGSTN